MARTDYKDITDWSPVEFQSGGKTYKGNFNSIQLKKFSL